MHFAPAASNEMNANNKETGLTQTTDKSVTYYGLSIGDRVCIERDETKYPPKGTWPQFRGKVGTIVEFNLGEIGVCFSKVTARTDGRGRFNWDTKAVAWFQPYEVASEHIGKPRVYVPDWRLGTGKVTVPARISSALESVTP